MKTKHLVLAAKHELKFTKAFKGNKLGDFQHWFHLEVETENHTQTVYACSTMHVNKRVKLQPQFSVDFKAFECVSDHNIIDAMQRKYGNVYKGESSYL